MRVFPELARVLVACLIVLAGGGVSYFLFAYPQVGPATDIVSWPRRSESLGAGTSPDHVAVCTDCHSRRDWSRFAGPIVAGTYAAGGEVFDESMGLPGRVVSRNITPGALGTWTDGEILRAMTEGVSKDGSPLFPLMPYRDHGTHMDPEDAPGEFDTPMPWQSYSGMNQRGPVGDLRVPADRVRDRPRGGEDREGAGHGLGLRAQGSGLMALGSGAWAQGLAP